MSEPEATKAPRPEVVVRNTRPEDFAQIIQITREVYHASPSCKVEQLASHLEMFPRGSSWRWKKKAVASLGWLRA